MRTLSYLIVLGFILSGCNKNYPPRIVTTEFVRLAGIGNTTYQLRVEATDADLDDLEYLWEATEGSFVLDAGLPETEWQAPTVATDKEYQVHVTVSDGKESVGAVVTITVPGLTFGKLSGFVYYANCKVPLDSARVFIDGKETYTNTKGEYSIDGIRSGRHQLTAEKEGFDTGTTEVLIRKGINSGDVYLTSDLHTSMLSGQITGSLSGESRPYHYVTILNPDRSRSNLTAMSNSAGYYELKGIPRGLRRLIVSDDTRDRMETMIFIEENDRVFNIALPEPFSFTDTRDNHEYKAVKISGQMWMAENLAYIPHVSASYDQGGIWVYGYNGNEVAAAKSHPNYKNYGCLYDHKTAISDDHGNGKDICPPGWHLPTDDEWKILEAALGMDTYELDSVSWRYSGEVGKKLKSESGWESEGNGTNTSSFSAVPAGYRASSGSFIGQYGYTVFWTSTPYDEQTLWRRYLYYNQHAIGRFNEFGVHGFSVRCLKDR